MWALKMQGEVFRNRLKQREVAQTEPPISIGGAPYNVPGNNLEAFQMKLPIKMYRLFLCSVDMNKYVQK